MGKQQRNKRKASSLSKPKIDEGTLLERIEEYMESHDKTSIGEKDVMPLCTHLRRLYERDYKQIPLLDFKEICLVAIDRLLGEDESSSSSEEEISKEELEKRMQKVAKLKEVINNEKNSMNHQLQNVYKEQSISINTTNTTNTSAMNGNANTNTTTASTTGSSVNGNNSLTIENNELKRKREQEGNSTQLNSSISSTTSKEMKQVPASHKKIKSDPNAPKKPKILVETPNIRFNDIGGIDHILQDIRELIEYPILHPEIYTTLGVEPPRGILLHGPPGCGKTMLANAIAGELQIPFLKVSAPEIVSGMSGESEAKIRQIFRDAIANAPSIIFIDEIDAILSKRDNASKEMEKRIVAQLITCLDDLTLDKTDGKTVIIIGATNRPDSLDDALRRAGRFDREISLGIPDEKARMKILNILTRRLKLDGGGHENFDFKTIAHNTPGYVGADLKALVNEAAIAAIHRIFGDIVFNTTTNTNTTNSNTNSNTSSSNESSNEITATPLTFSENSPEDIKRRNIISETLRNMKEPLTEQQLANLYVTFADFEKAIKKVQPSAKREGFATVPNVTWDDIGALEEVREELRMAIMEPIKNPDHYKKLGLSAPAGVLLYGPPGCGKTLLAKAISNDSGANFISIKGPELLNKYVGESERAVRQVFSRAAASSPCVVFFDEMDALCPKRDNESSSQSSERVVNQLLTAMDGLESRGMVFVIAATNRPDMIDSAMLRPGRLDKLLYVKLPNEQERISVLKTIARKTPLAPDVNLEEIAKLCENFSGADLAALVREAATSCLKEHLLKGRGITSPESPSESPPESNKKIQEEMIVSREHFKIALKKIPPSVSAKDLRIYEKIANSLRTSRNHINMDEQPPSTPIVNSSEKSFTNTTTNTTTNTNNTPQDDTTIATTTNNSSIEKKQSKRIRSKFGNQENEFGKEHKEKILNKK